MENMCDEKCKKNTLIYMLKNMFTMKKKMTFATLK